MSGLYRSEDMTYVRVIMSDDAAYDTVRELGKFARLHVVDLSEGVAAAQAAAGGASQAQADSSYTHYKKRVAVCQYWERKLISFREAFTQYRIQVPDVLNHGEVAISELRSADVVEDCKSFIEPLEAAFTKNVLFRKQHRAQISEFEEYLQVLKFNNKNAFANAHGAAEFSFAASGRESGGYDEEKMEGGGARGASNMGGNRFTSTICGVIPTDKIPAFERLLFRISRGNAFSHFFMIDELITDPATGELVQKQVFAVTFMGEQLSRRISRIIAYAGATEYPLPGSPNEVMGLENDIRSKLADSVAVLKRTDLEIRSALQNLALDPATPNTPYNSPWINWVQALQRERAVCDILKKCESPTSHSTMTTLEGWVPSDAVDDLRFALAQAVRASQAKQAALQTFSSPPKHATPPTLFRTNAFTSSFQGIVDTYGVPRYKEVNPGLFTIISFPFLFGVMYGDIGHGTILFLFSLYLLYNEKKFLDLEKRGTLGEIPGMVFGGRYLLVMMGAFALYAGTIYNDCFSCPIHVIPSKWDNNANQTDLAAQNLTGMDLFQGPYPYGVDPSWYHTTNELAFFNSMKMKLAVTLGVTQMTFGICLGALNDVYFKDYLAIFFEFIPRLVFIMCTFGYMVFIIIFKMAKEWGPGTTPPLLIQTMIQMFLSPGSVTKENELYEGQGIIQAMLVLLAVFSVPFMLFPIPCITNARNKEYLLRIGKGGDNVGVQMQAMNLGSPLAGSALQENLLGEGAGADSEHSQASAPYGSYDARRPSSAVIIDDRNVEEKDQSVDSSPLIADEVPDGGHGDHALGEHYSYSDHLIVQGIHTIEFVLGTVSNTASYLRLWALSLAHAELSGVFWDKMIMQYGINGSNVFSPVLGFAVWAVATFAVLLAMDVLECFLHALRLHWVEFQNKFFRADGYAFEPFSFDKLESDKTA